MAKVVVLRASEKDFHLPKGIQNYNLENKNKNTAWRSKDKTAFIKVACVSLPEGYIIGNNPSVTDISVTLYHLNQCSSVAAIVSL